MGIVQYHSCPCDEPLSELPRIDGGPVMTTVMLRRKGQCNCECSSHTSMGFLVADRALDIALSILNTFEVEISGELAPHSG